MRVRKKINMDALEIAAGQPVKPIQKVEAKAAGTVPSRIGKVQIGVHVDPETRVQLKMLALAQERSIKDVMEEGIALVLSKHGKI